MIQGICRKIVEDIAQQYLLFTENVEEEKEEEVEERRAHKASSCSHSSFMKEEDEFGKTFRITYIAGKRTFCARYSALLRHSKVDRKER